MSLIESGILVGGALLALALIVRSIRFVPQGESWTVERMGRLVRVLEPGPGLINPVLSRVGHRVSMRERPLTIRAERVIFSDSASARVEAAVFIQVVDAGKAAYAVSELHHATEVLVLTHLRNVLGTCALSTALGERHTLNERLLEALAPAVEPWGVRILRVEMQEIEPPAELIEAMEIQLKADRGARARVLEAKGARRAAIERAEGERGAAVIEAQGRLQAAEKDAQARERLAEAEANATRSLAQALREGEDADAPRRAMEYFIAQTGVRALGTLAHGHGTRTLVVPTELAGLMGAMQTWRTAQQGDGPPHTANEPQDETER